MIKATTQKRILGIDPGTNIFGYAVIEVKGQQIVLIEYGALSLKHQEDQPQKLRQIFEDIQSIINRFSPTEMAIEAPFYGKNVQSMLKLGRAQGVAIAAGITKDLEITEYSPKKIKQSVTGNGNAAKEQVAAMLENILNCELKEAFLDSTDALATAVCHHFQTMGLKTGTKKVKNWNNFIKNNPDKVAK